MLIAIKSNIVEEVVLFKFIWSFIGFYGMHVDPCKKTKPKCTIALNIKLYQHECAQGSYMHPLLLLCF